jgi:(p)ppGpp synthase/HD superfamily hydrolase
MSAHAGDRKAEALAYATHWHRDQVRKGTQPGESPTPYVVHILGVASIVERAGGDEDEIIAALLHDVPEDHGGQARLDEIREMFGDRVADIVEALSDHLGPEGQKGDWWERKRAYVAHVATADRSTQLVCAADKLDNLTATLADRERLGEAVWDRFKTGREGQAWYYEAVCLGIEAGPNRDLQPVGGLRLAVTRLHSTDEGSAR